MGTAEQQAKGLDESGSQNKYLRGIAYLGKDMERTFYDDGHVESFRVRGPQEEGGEYMLVAKRVNDAGLPEVGFQTGLSVEAVLAGFGTRLRNGSVKWKPDRFATPPA